MMEDGHAEPMPVIQAIQRRPLESAASGNVRAQRDIKRVVARACPGHPIAFLPACPRGGIAGTSPATTPYVVQPGRNPLVMVLGSALRKSLIPTAPREFLFQV